MSPVLLALALCAQAPASQTVTLPDGNVYQVTYTRVSQVGAVPPPPDAGAPRVAMASPSQTQTQAPANPAKSTPQSVAPRYAAPSPQVQYTATVAAPQATVQYQYTQPVVTAAAVQPVALHLQQPMTSVVVRQPCLADRCIAKVGLIMYQRGLPRVALVPQAATLSLAAPATAVQAVQYQAAYPSAQQ
jgi:hypothetical protein